MTFMISPYYDITLEYNIITNITQNNTGMYTKDSSQPTFRIPNNDLDVRFEQAYQNQENGILQTRK